MTREHVFWNHSSQIFCIASKLGPYHCTEFWHSNKIQLLSCVLTVLLYFFFFFNFTLYHDCDTKPNGNRMDKRPYGGEGWRGEGPGRL